MTFDEKIKDGSHPNADTMAGKQAEGTAFLWNTLCDHNIALLADEVGMGKTFQAIATCCLLWRSKPNARVLVLTPNGSICNHWQKEYRTFIKNHYLNADNIVKTDIDDGCIYQVKAISKLQNLIDDPSLYKDNPFLLGKISSLSYLTTDVNKTGELYEVAKEKAIEIREELYTQKESGYPFDLIIIDEAQYFRTYGTHTQKNHAAQGFFGHIEEKEERRLADKVLLLTATPSHRSMNDVTNIIKYFSPYLASKSQSQDRPKEILNTIGLRRLRLLQAENKGFNKYEYRREEALSCDFGGNINAELFFALYQKELANNLTSSGNKHLYGYLEGFESAGRKPETMIEDSSDTVTEDTEKLTKDFIKAKDSEILNRLSKKYYETYSSIPNHPKYTKLVEELSCHKDSFFKNNGTCLMDNKHLLFVRRIPSVMELTQRANESYEEIFSIRIIQACFKRDNQEQLKDRSKEWKKNHYSRAFFTNSVLNRGNHETKGDEDEDAAVIQHNEGQDDDEQDNISYKCRVLDIFSTKKDKSILSTHASRFRLRFSIDSSPFSLFFEAAKDYQKEAYVDFTTEDAKKKYRTYSRSCRINKLSESDAISLKEYHHYPNSPTNEKKLFNTLWGLCYSLLENESPLLKKEMDDFSIKEKEEFSRYVRAGLLFASAALVELYAWYLEYEDTNYQGYIKKVEKSLKDSLTYRLWREALSTFKTYINKIKGISNNQLLESTQWNCFTNPPQQPAWYVNGGTPTGTRENIRTAFNSPFFPNVLVSTSVFQEGVNLHLNCSQVHHYGIANSVGDSEQRVGRVDRLFGRINRKLTESPDSNLTISYPFLKGTFDEKQLVSFLKRKDSISSKMDECLLPKADNEIKDDLIEKVEQYLHNPEKFKTLKTKDPYPANRNISEKAESYKPIEEAREISVSRLIEDIKTASGQLKNISTDLYLPKQGESSYLIFIGARRINDNERYQPVMIERHYSRALLSTNTQTGGSYLRFKSPLGNKTDIEKISETKLLKELSKYSKIYSLPKLCLDSNNDDHFHAYLAVDLPIFARDDEQTSLSIDEIKLALEQLIHCTDELEKVLLKTDFIDEAIESRELQKIESSHNPRASKLQTISSQWFTTSNNKKLASQPVVYSNLATLFIGDWRRCAFSNNKTPFVNHLLFGEENHVGICYPNMDFQKKEQQLLLDVCNQNVALEKVSEANNNIQVVIDLFKNLMKDNSTNMARIIWNHAYKQQLHLSSDIPLTRQTMRGFIENIASDLLCLRITIPFWEKGKIGRKDLLEDFSKIDANSGDLGLILLHEHYGDEVVSSWQVLTRLSDYNLLISHTEEEEVKQKRLSLDKVMVRNDQVELTENFRRPYQIKPMDYLFIESAISEKCSN